MKVTDDERRDGVFRKDSAGDECFYARVGDDVPNRHEMSREVGNGKAAVGKGVKNVESFQEDETNTTGGFHPPDRDAALKQNLRQHYTKMQLSLYSRKL